MSIEFNGDMMSTTRRNDALRACNLPDHQVRHRYKSAPSGHTCSNTPGHSVVGWLIGSLL